MKKIYFISFEPSSYVAYFILIDRVISSLNKIKSNKENITNIDILFINERIFSGEKLNFSFHINKYKINFIKIKNNIVLSLLILPLSSILAIYFYLILCIFNFNINHLSLNGVFFGDSLLSIALRRSSNARIKISIRIYLYLFRIINIIIKMKMLNIKKRINYLIIFDWHYYERIIFRCLDGANVNLINSISYENSDNIQPITNSTKFYPFIVNKNSDDIKHFKENVNEFMKNRIKNPGSFQWYLKGNGNINSQYLFNEDGENLFLSENNKFYACLFLHSFVDGYIDSVWDGFIDQIDYLEFIIKLLLKNKNYEKILIKPHPQSFTKIYPNDTNGINYLKAKFDDKIIFLNKQASLIALSKFKVICFSHHGSVVEECHYLGMPCVGFKYGPWMSYSDFLYTWSNKNELAKLIELNPINLPFKNNEDYFRYIYEYRIKYKNNLQYPFLECTAKAFGISHSYSFQFGHDIAMNVRKYGLKKSINNAIIYYKNSNK